MKIEESTLNCISYKNYIPIKNIFVQSQGPKVGDSDCELWGMQLIWNIIHAVYVLIEVVIMIILRAALEFWKLVW